MITLKIVKSSFWLYPAKPYFLSIFCNQFLRSNSAIITHFKHLKSLIKVRDYGLNYLYIST